jgi:Uma2 family endonuclease
MTLEQFARLPEANEYTLELVDGLVVREPRPGYAHGVVHTRLAELPSAHVRKQRLGVVLVETGYVLDAEAPTVRGPDLSFISTARLPELAQRKSFPRMAPDGRRDSIAIRDATRHSAQSRGVSRCRRA